MKVAVFSNLLLICSLAGSVFAQPVITKQPVNQSVSLGAKIIFQVTASGTSPLAYQWHFDQALVPDATSRTLTLTNIQMAYAGDYFVIVTNASGCVTSQVARLEVDTTFAKITSGLIVPRAGSGRGCAWGDYNNDGFIDLYVANSAADGRGTTGGADFLFQNNRDGTFTDVRAAARITDPVDSQGCVWADYDNDGHLDLFVSSYFGGNNKNTLYRNQGDGTFAKVGADKLVSEGGNSTASAWGDFNNDGFIDLVVANSLFSGSPSLDLF